MSLAVAHRHTPAAPTTAASARSMLCTAALLFVLFLLYVRLFDGPWNPTAARCEKKRKSAEMHWKQVCANPADRVEQEIDHCLLYARDKSMSVRWCTLTTLFTDASLMRVAGKDFPVSLVFMTILALTALVCVLLLGCCAAVYGLEGRRARFALPTTAAAQYPMSPPPPSPPTTTHCHALPAAPTTYHHQHVIDMTPTPAHHYAYAADLHYRRAPPAPLIAHLGDDECYERVYTSSAFGGGS